MKNETSEVSRQKRVVDQMLTSHSLLRDRYRRRARLLNLVLLVLGVALCALTFASTDNLSSIGVSPPTADFLLRVVAVAVFLISLIEARLNWSGLASIHGDAADRLFRIKQKHRELLDASGELDSDQIANLKKEYLVVHSNLPEIPERHFLQLKAKHLRKVGLSRRLDTSPGRPVWLIKWDLFREGLKGSKR